MNEPMEVGMVSFGGGWAVPLPLALTSSCMCACLSWGNLLASCLRVQPRRPSFWPVACTCRRLLWRWRSRLRLALPQPGKAQVSTLRCACDPPKASSILQPPQAVRQSQATWWR
jgi:hypothetical protein